MNFAQALFSSSIHRTSDLIRHRISDEETTADSTIEMMPSSDADCAPVSLEGFLLYRMGRSSGQSSLLWKRRFVYFSFANGGSITVYKESPNFNVNKMNAVDENQSKGALRSVYRRFSSFGVTDASCNGVENVDFDITSALPWIAKDVERDPSSFVVEIQTFNDDDHIAEESYESASNQSGDSEVDAYSQDTNDLDFDISGEARSEDEDSLSEDRLRSSSAVFGDSDFDFEKNGASMVEFPQFSNNHDLRREMEHARKKGKPLRIYFRCEKGGNEKALWLRAFATFGRLSSECRRQKRLLSSLTGPLHLGSSRARIRSVEDAVLARDTRNLDLSENVEDTTDVDISSVEQLVLGNSPGASKDREFRVLPTYAYPHRWMTIAEMRQEMVLGSEHFHDLRVTGCTAKEIGELKVEILQCLGLPKLDRTADTDAVAYLVCGAYSFVTDVIPNRQNPMWLRKSRRACSFPLFHGYASLYVGVFDYEPKKSRDDFAGRVEINLAKLRPGSTYDVTLPLRLSSHVYSRRKRGAIRLRFSLKWNSERDALLSYIPRSFRIPLPQNSAPNFDVTVRCTDPKAFRNIAITVHGAHLPGRFTFVQMRAAIREINFTRKYLFTALRQSVRELRQWQCPSMSAYVFLSWMHCIYANKFSLVPAYALLFFLIILMCNYVRYGTDEPSQCGFIPPSWEEMFMALTCGKRPGYRAIEPLELVPRKYVAKRRRLPSTIAENQSEYIVSTHVPKGKGILKCLGLIPSKPRNAAEEHQEFPFSNGSDYPRFGVKESLIHRKRDAEALNKSLDSQCFGEARRERSSSNDSQNNPLARFSLDMDLPDIMRRDASGTMEFDEEERNFQAAKVVLATGKQAKVSFSKTASALSNKTGLNSCLVNPLQSGIDLGVSHVNYLSSHMVHSTRSLVSGNNSAAGGAAKRAFFQGAVTKMDAVRGDSSLYSRGDESFLLGDATSFRTHGSLPSVPNLTTPFDASVDVSNSEPKEMDPALVLPEQDIDVEGPQSGKKLTDDLAEVKDKMHELTWHLFDDHTYVIKNSNTVYFGDARKSEKKRKPDVKKQIDKYLGLSKYSYSNPFVARVGLYVEPIIGSTYSFLCLFRAGFNLLTWRDPMMTFWLSCFCGVMVIILFIFPWRLFLFVVGVLIMGPQNWVIRIMRERGHLNPAPEYHSMQDKLHRFDEEIYELPTDVPIVTSESRKPGNEPRTANSVADDPREIHHVVVPYSPLIHQRCYDWPPEPQFALVKRDAGFDERKPVLKKDYALNETLSRKSTTSDPTFFRRPRMGVRSRLGRRRLASASEDSVVSSTKMSSAGHRRVATDLTDAALKCE